MRTPPQLRTLTLSILASLALQACGDGSTVEPEASAASAVPAAATPAVTTQARVDQQRLLGTAAEPGQWLTYGGTYNEQRYSQLSEINTENVAELGLAWFADYDTNLQQEGTPLFIDGVL